MNDEHYQVVLQGADAIEKWRWQHPGEQLVLRGVDLIERNLCNANLSLARFINVNLANTVLAGSNLAGFTLEDSSLVGTDFSRARLTDARLRDCNFNVVNFDGADLTAAEIERCQFYSCWFISAKLSVAKTFQSIFYSAEFEGADLRFLQLHRSAILNTDLSKAIAVDKIHSPVPNVIGIDTIYKSKGTIPESLLRASGVPDGLIAYLPSLLGMQEAIQFYSCFISFSFKDQAFCDHLHSRMRADHLRVWYAAEDMPGGKKVHEVIESTIRLYDKLLLVLSEASMASEWVKTEIRHARQRELKEGKRVLFPISLVPFEAIREWKAFDADTGKDMAVEIREYFIPDFSNWKNHDAFEKAFARLRRDLKDETRPTS